MGWEAGGRFKRQGTYAYLWLNGANAWQKPTQYCKAIILQLKMDILKKKQTPRSDRVGAYTYFQFSDECRI